MSSPFSATSPSASSPREPDSMGNGPYTGYRPVAYAELLLEDESFLRAGEQRKPSINASMLGDYGRKSKSLVLFVVLFAIAFIAIFVWQILIAKCRVSTFCETIDESSDASSDYLFKTITFRVPSALIWIGLSAGSLCLLVAVIWAYFLVRKSVYTARMAEVSTILRKGTNTFVTQHYIWLLIPVLAGAVLLGLGINWKTAGCFGIGALTCLVAVHSGVSIANRGHARIPPVLDEGAERGFSIAFRSGAIINLSIFATATVGSVALYLMFSDIRALAGLSIGTSLVAFFLRLSSGIFSASSNKSAAILALKGNNSRYPGNEDESRWMVAFSAPGLAAIVGMASELFSCLACAITATSILGSGLPFFYRDSFAVCIFNHLTIDQDCGPFGYPQALSYSIYICSNDKLYLKYPALTTWASNSAFVALPFVLAAVGLLVSKVCTLYAQFGSHTRASNSTADGVVPIVRRNIRVNIGVGYALFIICSAALVFGLLGRHSEFQRNNGFRTNNLLRMELDGSDSQCISKFLDSSSTAMADPVPIPQGGVLKPDHYRPITVSGVSLGAANTTPWRLFGCIVIGAILSAIITATHTNSFPWSFRRSTRQLSDSPPRGRVSPSFLHTFGRASMSTVLSTLLISFALIISQRLFGSYGTALMGLSFISSVNCHVSSSLMSQVLNTAKHIQDVVCRYRCAPWFSSTVSLLSMKLIPPGNAVLSHSTFLTSVILTLTILEHSNLLPSPRDLIGSPEEPPTRLIAMIDPPRLTSPLISLSLFLGATTPFLLSAVVLLTPISSTQHILSYASPTALTLFHKTTVVSLVNSLLPLGIAVTVPLIIGFSMGQKAVITFLVSHATASHFLSSTLSLMSLSWDQANNCCDGGTRTDDGEWRSRNAMVAMLRDLVSPSIITSSQLTAAITLAVIPKMPQNEGQDTWVGLVILGVTVGLAVVGIVMKSRIQRKRRGERGEMSDGKEERVQGLERVVAPFYETSPSAMERNRGWCETSRSSDNYEIVVM